MPRTAKQLTRRDFLSTGARLGAGLAAASAGVASLSPSGSRASAAQTTLTYIGIANLPGVKEAMIAQFEKSHPGVKVTYLTAPSTEGDELLPRD